jgi:hypothetical protein
MAALGGKRLDSKSENYSVSLNFDEGLSSSQQYSQNYAKKSENSTDFIPSTDEFDFMASAGLSSPTGMTTEPRCD